VIKYSELNVKNRIIIFILSGHFNKTRLLLAITGPIKIFPGKKERPDNRKITNISTSGPGLILSY